MWDSGVKPQTGWVDLSIQSRLKLRFSIIKNEFILFNFDAET